MKIWLDAQLSPALAPWMSERFAVSAGACARHVLVHLRLQVQVSGDILMVHDREPI